MITTGVHGTKGGEDLWDMKQGDSTFTQEDKKIAENVKGTSVVMYDAFENRELINVIGCDSM